MVFSNNAKNIFNYKIFHIYGTYFGSASSVHVDKTEVHVHNTVHVTIITCPLLIEKRWRAKRWSNQLHMEEEEEEEEEVVVEEEEEEKEEEEEEEEEEERVQAQTMSLFCTVQR